MLLCSLFIEARHRKRGGPLPGQLTDTGDEFSHGARNMAPGISYVVDTDQGKVRRAYPRSNHCTYAGTPPHHSFFYEFKERAPRRGQTDAILVAQLILRREKISRGEFPAANSREQLLAQLLIERPPTVWLKTHTITLP